MLGITLDRGLIKDIHDPVAGYVRDGGYASAHNQLITWEQHTRQTSEWEGAMWGKNANFVGHEAFGKGERQPRAIQPPGTYWEYNDARINRFSLSLLTVWKKPLPLVIKQEILDPIGAPPTHLAVPALRQLRGPHRGPAPTLGERGHALGGGGLWISARDEARFGYLLLRQAAGAPASSCRRAGCGRPPPAARRPRLRLFVVAQHRAESWPQRPRHQLRRPGRRLQHHLGRPRARYRHRLALAQRLAR